MIIKIEGNIIIFKSTPENYNKEFSGLKSNTERRIVLWSELKAIEVFYYSWFANDDLIEHKIRIINTETRESFERTLTDISRFEGVWVFSWRPE